jgi:hypothetical protein
MKRGRKEKKKRERFAFRCIIAHFVDKTSLFFIFRFIIHSFIHHIADNFIFIPLSITLPTSLILVTLHATFDAEAGSQEQQQNYN